MTEETVTILNEPDEVSGTDTLPIDILGRDELLNQIMNLLMTLSDAKSSCTFALNGKWGAGKTYIVEKLEQQLEVYESTEKFIVFHYNCWQYDYYEEPLIAIIAAMQDSIEKKTNLLRKETREKAEKALSITKNIAKQMAFSFAEKKLGIDLENIDGLIEKGTEDSEKKQSARHSTDSYYDFKKAIDKVRQQMSTLSESATLLIVVDELDRCLPEYAIRVLERLHHLFYGMGNTIVLAALDREQLGHTVERIFGEGTNVGEYLRKFLDFEVTVDIGIVQGNFFKKYESYVSLFDGELLPPWSGIGRYFTELFSEMDIRTQEHLIKKMETIHRLLFSGEKKDYSYLCFEILMAVYNHYAPGTTRAPIFYQGSRNMENYKLVCAKENLPQKFVSYIQDNWNFSIAKQIAMITSDSRPLIHFPGELDIPRLLICYSEDLYNHRSMSSLSQNFPQRNKSSVQDFKEVQRLLWLIK